MKYVAKLLFKFRPICIIKNSLFFDAKWYSEQYGTSIKRAAIDYLNEGWKKNNNPSPLFSTKDYLLNNPDINNINPLLHFEVFGKNEGRIAFPIRKIIKADASGNNTNVFHMEDCYKLIESSEIISFDIFDTLIKRPFTKPSDLFLYIEKKYSARDFSKSRIAAEELGRKTLNKEINIDEIYDYISDEYKNFKEIELNEELALCETNPIINKIFDKAKELNKKIIIISDMYIKRDFLQSLLVKNGYDIKDIYVSCEYNKTKSKGDLFDAIVDKYKINPSKILHIGDNYLSDYVSATKQGISAINTPIFIDSILTNRENRYLDIFSNSNDNLSSTIYTSLCANYLFEGNKTILEKLGFILGGPLALSYVNFVCEQAVSDNIDKLFFAARDGYVLKKVYEKYFLDKYQIPCSYTYLSRATALLATFNNKANISVLLKVLRTQLAFINVNDNEEENLKRYYEYSDEINKYLVKRNAELEKHLIDEAGNSVRIAVVDMASKSLTSLKCAMRYLGNKVYTGYFVGTFNNKETIRHNTFLRRHLGIMDNLSIKISELLITSFESPIIGVENNKPIYEFSSNKKREDDFNDILKGILSYCECFVRRFDIGKENLMSFEQWLELCECYLLYCSEDDLAKLENSIDYENLVSDTNDKNIKELIIEYRNKLNTDN